jgi:2,4-dienoyl-CoA reductase-like NADH-dependent reductase (Old Yellow Enzyme family)
MSSTTVADELARPARIGSLELRNPLAVAPMSRVSAGPGGLPTRRMADYYESFARGGFGLVITEGVYTDTAFSRAYPAQPGLVTAEQVDGWRQVTSAVRARGGRIVAQLMHAGALSQVLDVTIAPSAVSPLGSKMPEYGGGDGPFPVPAAATADDLAEAVAGFAAAAAAARRAGFDGVEIHGANGYLIDQFVTTYTNRRVDGYGGSPQARARLAVEIVEAVREAVGDGFTVGIRLSQTKVNDVRYRWSLTEATALLRTIGAARPDYVHIASEGRDWEATARIDGGPTLTRLAREITGAPVIANGGMHDPARARRVLGDGEADLLALARGALANPDWPARVAAGLPLRPWDHDVLSPAADLASQDSWVASKVDDDD